MDANQILTFGDTRRMIVQTISDIRSGHISPAVGTACFAGFKELTANIQVEINAAKLAMATEGKAHSFGRVVGMGRRLIGNDGAQES